MLTIIISNYLYLNFSKIDTSEIYEEPWTKTYTKIYNVCMKNKSPIQMIDMGATHTIMANTKGKLYSFGWNNFGQCGISPSCNNI